MDDQRLHSRRDKDHPAPFTPRFADRSEWEKRAKFLRTQVLVSQGLWPMPAKKPLNAVIHGAIDRGDYTVEKVYFESLPGHLVCGNLYRPKGKTGPFPIVLHPYGHWKEGRFAWNDDKVIAEQIESGAETTREGARSPLQAACAMLSRMGCIVFHYDMVGYCDSKPLSHTEGFDDVEAILRLQSNMGLQTWNSIRAIDFVLSLPNVDPARVAVTGASGGGTQSILLTAVDERITCSFPVVMTSMNMQGGCVCENASLLRIDTNNVELAALAAPRPQGAAGAEDWTHDFETRGLPELTKIYALYGAEDNVSGKVFPFPHNFNLHSRELLYEFLNRHFKLGSDEPLHEKPFEPIPPQQLSVFRGDEQVPATLDVKALRASMSKQCQLDLPALRTMLVDPFAANLPIHIREQSYPFGSQAGEWKGVLSRAFEDEVVGCRAIVPQRFAGDVLIVAHSKGASGLDAADDLTNRAIEAGWAVIAADIFPHVPLNAAHPVLELGYNRTTLAERVRDLLTLISFCRQTGGIRTVKLLGVEDASIAATLACAVAPKQIDLALIEQTKFDFNQIKDINDPNLLPGALKYGGMTSIRVLCAKDRTHFSTDVHADFDTFIQKKPGKQRMSSAIVSSQFLYEEATFPSCHASTIVETHKGMLAAFFGGTHERNPDVCIYTCRLIDGKWSAPMNVADGVQPDGSRQPTWNPVLFQPKNGPIMLFYKVGPNPREWWGEVKTSKDEGFTWSDAIRLPDGILGPIKNKAIQLDNGDILSPTSVELGKDLGWKVYFERSTDGGKTWTKTPHVDQPEGVNAIQPSILIHSQQKLQAIGRTKSGKMFDIWSEDAGKTWGRMKLIDLPNCNSGTDAVTLRDGRHLLIYNHSATEKVRYPLNLAISDDGIVWKATEALETEPPGQYSYPAIIQSSNGFVHVTYTWKRQRIKHAVIDPTRLVPRQMDNGQWPEKPEET